MKTIFGVFLALALAGAGAASGKICVMDQVPAATLLLPYFEVDLADPNGMTTLFTVNNSSSKAVLAKVEIWSDLGVPVFGFTIYLTGYDVERIDLRKIISTGALPQTDPPLGSFPSCDGYLPLAPLSPATLDHIQKSLTGNPSPMVGGKCAGVDHGDSLARGYVTVDVVSVCSLQYQGDAGYFVSGGQGVPTNDNILWGDFFLLNRTLAYAQGGPLVHIEASDADPETSTAGQYTFYGRFVGWTAIDNREPLVTTFGAGYFASRSLSKRTDLLVWRDPKVVQGHFTCPATPGVQPPWYPLGQEAIHVFDEEENRVVPKGEPFPKAAQRTAVGGGILPFPALPVPYKAGWLYLNLNVEVPGVVSPPEDPGAAQAWVIPVLDPGGMFNTGFGAVQYDTACDARHEKDW